MTAGVTAAAMGDWLAASAQLATPAVLVTLALAEGSVPREAGAKMLVTGAAHFDTIGGGHLEWRALAIARAMLTASVPAARIERFALGPSLGQCCGGVAHLVFEPVDAALAAVLAGLRQRRGGDSWRLAALDGAPAPALLDAAGHLLVGAAPPPFERVRATRLLRDRDGRRWLLDACVAPRAHLTLFGAGHVGAALVRALAELPCSIDWVDQRAELFPALVPANVSVCVSDVPEMLVEAAPAGASFLVMTHSHALDLQLAEAILARADAGWFGLIGSHSKRARFEQRLRVRGFAPQRIAAMVCPIGLPGIAGKAPAVIAASVCCQLLMVWEAAALAAAKAGVFE